MMISGSLISDIFLHGEIGGVMYSYTVLFSLLTLVNIDQDNTHFLEFCKLHC